MWQDHLFVEAVLQFCTATHLQRRFFLVSIAIHLNCLCTQFSAAHSISFNVCVVYHPPASSRSSGTSSEFCTELECLFTEASVSVTPTIIADDFNIHFDDVTKSEPLRDLRDAFNLLQHFNSPTHYTGHTLDLVISGDSDNLVSSVVVYPDLRSDHHCIALTLNISKPETETSVTWMLRLSVITSNLCVPLLTVNT